MGRRKIEETTEAVKAEEVAVEEVTETEEYENGKLEDVEELEELVEDAVASVLSRFFEKRRYTMMSKEERDEAYKTKKVSGKKGTVKTEAQRIQEEAKELLFSAQSVPKVPLRGVVYGYEFSEVLGIPLVLVSRPGKPHFVIKIPVSQFMVYDERNYIGEEGKRALDRELRSRIGSEIDFVVFDLQEKERFAIASRLSAMEIIAKKNYTPVHGNKKPLIRNGSTAEAKVICVKNNLVKVEVSGLEAVIRSEELSWRALESLTQEFEVGDTFHVIVNDIEEFEYEALNQKYKLFKANVSKRLADPNPAEQFFHQFAEGQRIGGVIKVHNENGVFIDLAGKMDILCPHPATGMPIRGARCIVEITNIDENKLRLYGRIVG